MAMGVDGTKATHGTAETAGMTTGTTLGATEEEPTGTILGAMGVATTGTIHGAGTVLGATADIMATGATAATAVLAASAVITDGTIKARVESSLAAVARVEVLPNLPLTMEYGASKSNRE